MKRHEKSKLTLLPQEEKREWSLPSFQGGRQGSVNAPGTLWEETGGSRQLLPSWFVIMEQESRPKSRLLWDTAEPVVA